MPKTTVLAPTVLFLAMAAAGCGGTSKSSSSASSGGAGGTSSQSTTASAPAPSAGVLTDAADPSGQLTFTKKSLSANAGKVTLHFTNRSSIPHNFTIESSGGGADVGATPTFSGGTKTLTVNLKPGTYTFFCSVPGHRQAGMQGTLTVK